MPIVNRSFGLAGKGKGFMEKTLIYIVRHGESLGNAARVMLGHTDLDLSELGYSQAAETAKALAGVKIDGVYSSDLLRAYNTALPHAEMRGLRVVPSRNLRELSIGKWEGRSVDDIISEYGEETFIGKWRGNFGTFAFPGGESVQGGCDRFYNEVLRIARAEAGKTVLIAAHAAVIRAFFARVLGISPEDIVAKLPFSSNASYSTVQFDGERFIAGEYSVDKHLEGVGITTVGT